MYLSCGAGLRDRLPMAKMMRGNKNPLFKIPKSCYSMWMARNRKRHIQLALPKCDKNGQHRGGARAGAGRKRKDGRKTARPGEPHKPRLFGKARFPRHIVLRV